MQQSASTLQAPFGNVQQTPPVQGLKQQLESNAQPLKFPGIQQYPLLGAQTVPTQQVSPALHVAFSLMQEEPLSWPDPLSLLDPLLLSELLLPSELLPLSDPLLPPLLDPPLLLPLLDPSRPELPSLLDAVSGAPPSSPLDPEGELLQP